VTKLQKCNGISKIQTLSDSILIPRLVCENQSYDTSIIIRNTGNCILSLIDIQFSGLDSSEFSIILPINKPLFISQNDSVNIDVRFTPSKKIGIKKGILALSNNSSINPYVIYLSARNDSIAFKVNNTESDTIIIELDTICAGSYKDTTITIFNKSSIGTTFKIENVDPQIQIKAIDKAEKKEENVPLKTKKRKK
jgi:hypothetical protein